MKKNILIIVLFFYKLVFSQVGVTPQEKENNFYLFKAEKFDNWLYFEDGECFSYFRISVKYEDNTIQEKYYFNLQPYVYKKNGDWYIDLRDHKFNFLIDKKIKSIITYYHAKEQPESGRCNGRNAIERDHTRENSSLVMCSLMNTSIYDVSSRELKFVINNNYRLIPLHTLKTDVIDSNQIPVLYNSYLPSGDKINLLAKEGFAADVYHYQYSLDNISWINIDSSLSTLNKLSISAKDILGDSYSQYIGKKIYFRVVSCFENGTPQSWSEPVPLTIIQSAPHILPNSNPSQTKCFDTEDGSVTLNFDRTLLPEETLEISLVNTETKGAVRNVDITADLQSQNTYILQNLPPGKYELGLKGTYKGAQTYTDASTHTTSFEITKSKPVIFDSPSKTDVFCFQGNDGIINLTASGGQNQFQYSVTKDGQPFLDWINFDNGNNASIQGLSAGTYKIKVRDTNLCIAKEPNNSSVEKEITVTITQPSAPISLPNADIEVVQPTGYGLSNGYISVRVTGGTPNADGSYNFEWRKDTPTGTIISTGIITDNINNPYTIKLANLTAGKYYLTVKDKNYTSATSELGNCGIISQEFIVTQPDPLVATIEVEKPISCNIANNYPSKLDLDNNGVPDEAEDGNLKAVVTGGVGAYSYQWQIFTGGIFQNIPGETQPILNNRSAGIYKVLVHDVNNNMTDAEYTFVYPPQLAISLSANTISCYNQSSGMVSVNATGGTGNYSYEWSTGDTNATVTGLTGGNYFVLVSDSKNCKIKGNVQVEQPDQIIITDISVKNPVCFGASNGEIKTFISGGKAPYTISWSNGVTGTENTGISAGDYTVTVTDVNGCSSTKQYTLVDPAQRRVDLGADVTLCLGDTKTYNVKIDDDGATYEWKDQNGNVIGTSSEITLSTVGTYTVLITDSKGCIATDSVTIKNSLEVLDPQFMLATHAYSEATVVLVNTSPTKPQAMEWIIPNNNNIQVINKTNDYLELKFLTTGSYEIGLKGIQGDCVKTFYKNVVVEENNSGVNLTSAKATNITEFNILPNPNNGIFQVLVGLGKEESIKIRILDMVSHEVFPSITQPQATYFVVPFSASIPAGMYLVILETGDEVMVKRMIVK
ncbi:T9SS type A sorting domain-containing protein [Riemerella anatipestifer]|uniref:T9SS type A sorting domain-containing protein n=1 Tax=Riemerella anatipestifer TaxID=34085 RepID=UPI0021A9EDE5|nr:T9SS type A sorting domain-containing protein [Riemerella anatipestifer]